MIGERLEVLAKIYKVSITDLGIGAGLARGTINRWIDKPVTFHNTSVETLLNYYRVNREWWKSGEGEPLDKVPESVDRIELYERLIKTLQDSKTEAWEQAGKWETEAKRLYNLLEIALKSLQSP